MPKKNHKKLLLLLIPLVLIIAIVVVIIVVASSPKMQWECSNCGAEWDGQAYYNNAPSGVWCENCAKSYHGELYADYTVLSDSPSTEQNQAEATEPEVTAPAVTYTEYGNYFPDSPFSEDLACVGFNGKYAYIDRQGVVQFFLPEGYDSGECFYEGCAIITNGLSSMYDTDKYSVIDKTGKVIIDGPANDLVYISRASEGMICAVKEVESHTGTTVSIIFYDLKGNVVTTIENFHDNSYYVHLGYFQFGNVCVADSDVYPTAYHYYDKSGKLVKTIQGIASLQGDEQYKYVPDSVSYKRGTIFDRKNLKVVSEIDKIVHNDSPSKNAEYFAYSVYDKTTKTSNFVISDRYGNKNSYTVEGFGFIREQETRDDNRWILQLQNDFYAVVNEKGEFVIGPVKSDIHYVGESMYFVEETKTVMDKDGNELFVTPYDVEYNMIASGEGVNENYYIDKQGNVLTTIKVKN